MNLISHDSDMNYESAKFANVNVWFLKINLMRCPATRSHTILYRRNELILLLIAHVLFTCLLIASSIPFVLIDMSQSYDISIAHLRVLCVEMYFIRVLVTNGPFVFHHKLSNSDRPSAVLRCWNVLINKKTNSPFQAFKFWNLK